MERDTATAMHIVSRDDVFNGLLLVVETCIDPLWRLPLGAPLRNARICEPARGSLLIRGDLRHKRATRAF